MLQKPKRQEKNSHCFSLSRHFSFESIALIETIGCLLVLHADSHPDMHVITQIKMCMAPTSATAKSVLLVGVTTV